MTLTLSFAFNVLFSTKLSRTTYSVDFTKLLLIFQYDDI